MIVTCANQGKGGKSGQLKGSFYSTLRYSESMLGYRNLFLFIVTAWNSGFYGLHGGFERCRMG